MFENLTREQEDFVMGYCSSVDLEKRYVEFLDEMYEEVTIGCSTFQPSDILKELDPTAFRCGMVDWEDSEGFVEIQGEYYDPNDVKEALGEFEDLKEQEEADNETDRITDEEEPAED